ncbi:TonB-dependent siderophore receptor [Teredinibacter purpureus]|uniref:TonB-dependent siderophore receptor n=1 Tax=Teredinibacter purpureus TaxID=2731756 RepID=UPI0005F85B36|nr:TonB-dependent receptor [Teredinibacter purpureus]
MNKCHCHSLATAVLIIAMGVGSTVGCVKPVFADTRGTPNIVASLRAFDLPAQSLQAGLVEFAIQSSSTIVADQHLLKGYRTTPVLGPLPTDTALRLLLSSTALEFVYVATSDAYVITAKPPTPEAGETTRSTDSEQAIIDELLVTGSRYPFRYNTVTNTQLHAGVAYFDSSRFFNVLPQTLIEDIQATSLDDILKYASGVLPGDGLSDTNDDARIRGYARQGIYVDGFRLDGRTGVRLMPVNIQQAEVVKGPATLRYGQGEPGGVINVVRKKPMHDTFTHLRMGGGDNGRGLFELDTNGRLTSADNIQYRFVAATEKQDLSGELSNLYQHLLAPSLSWQPSGNTRVDVGFEYQQSSQVLDRDFDVLNDYDDSRQGTTLSQVAGQSEEDFTSHSNLFSAEVSHYFSSEWRGHARFNVQQEYRYGIRTTTDTLLNNDLLVNLDELGDDFTLFFLGGQLAVPIVLRWDAPDWRFSLGRVRGLYDEESQSTITSGGLGLQGTLPWQSTTHHLSFGADWRSQQVEQRYIIEERDLLPGQTWTEAQTVQALDDVIAALTLSANTANHAYADYHQELHTQELGLYAQDSIELNDYWVASMGLRYSLLTAEEVAVDGQTATQPKYWQWSTQLGLVYRISERYSLFSNYNEGFRVNRVVDASGNQPADPEFSQQVEAGFKALLLEGRMVAGVAVYAIEKENIVETKRIEGVRTIQQAYSQRVQGIDMDISLQASDDINVIAAGSFMLPEITSGENTGLVPALAAEQTASLFGFYALNENLTFNGGFKYVSERFAENENNWLYGAYTTIDLGAGLHLPLAGETAHVTLTVKNVLDQRYNTATVFGVRENTSAGRTAVLSVSVDF